MIHPLKRLAAWGLNLDAPMDVTTMDCCVETGLKRKDQWRAIRFLLRQALGENVSAIHIFCDQEDGFFRMLYCIPQEGDAWYEMVSFPNVAARQIIRKLRQRAEISSLRPEGTIRYLYQGSLRKAACVLPTLDDLRIFFTDQRPRTLNKKAGDKPGIPTRPAAL